MMALAVRLSKQLFYTSHRGKRFLRREFFYNENVETYRPFNNTVRVRLENFHFTQENTEETSREIVKHLSSCGTINGQCVLNERRSTKSRRPTGYFNFSSVHEKEEALRTFKDHDPSLPFYEIRQPLDFVQQTYHNYDNQIPFTHLMMAAYRPSIHSSSRICDYLEKFGPSDGVETVNCPYDQDRKFLYFSYRDKSSLKNRNIRGHPYIKGSEVFKDEMVSEAGATCDDVYLYPFMDHNENNYKNEVLVRANSNVFSVRVKDFFVEKFGSKVEKVETLGADEEGVRYLVTFIDRYPVYRMFYPKTPFGQVIETIPNGDISDQLLVSIPKLPKNIWKHNYIRIFNAPSTVEDVIGFFNDFLDGFGLNPGIIAVSKTTASYYSQNLANRLRADPELRDKFASQEGNTESSQGESVDTYYELYFANPWHAVDVCHRLVLLNRAGVHNYFCTADMAFYGSVKRFLRTEEQEIVQDSSKVG